MRTNRLKYFGRAAQFNLRKHLCGYVINPEPTFDSEGLAFFASAIRNSRIYLEYGSGGSTILASKFASKIVSVETDAVFAKAVRKALPETAINVSILTPDIGFTRELGFPVFDRPSPSRIAKWKRLPQAPWNRCFEPPDLILIDGRMRVACALESLLQVGAATRILLDDYVGRDYGAVEQFANLVAMHGRIAEFRKRDNFDEQACQARLDLAYSDVS